MTILIVSFLVLGSLLCVLIGADHHAANAVEAARVRSFDHR